MRDTRWLPIMRSMFHKKKEAFFSLFMYLPFSWLLRLNVPKSKGSKQTQQKIENVMTENPAQTQWML